MNEKCMPDSLAKWLTKVSSCSTTESDSVAMPRCHQKTLLPRARPQPCLLLGRRSWTPFLRAPPLPATLTRPHEPRRLAVTAALIALAGEDAHVQHVRAGLQRVAARQRGVAHALCGEGWGGCRVGGCWPGRAGAFTFGRMLGAYAGLHAEAAAGEKEALLGTWQLQHRARAPLRGAGQEGRAWVSRVAFRPACCA